jgi:hypothetical protein
MARTGHQGSVSWYACLWSRHSPRGGFGAGGGVATCHLCLPCGYSLTGDSQERGRAGLWVRARSISQRESLLASEASSDHKSG